MTSFNILRVSKQRISSLSVTVLPLSLAHTHSNLREACARHHSSYSNSRDSKVLTVSSINQNLVKLRYEVRGTVAKRADEIRRDLKVRRYMDYRLCIYLRIDLYVIRMTFKFCYCRGDLMRDHSLEWWRPTLATLML